MSMSEPSIDVQVDADWDVRHGFASFPESRALKLHSSGYGGLEPHSLELGQGWPGMTNPSPVGNTPVPPDGMLASAGHSRWSVLDQPQAPNGKPWPATPLKPGGLVHVKWNITASHKVRGFWYYCTRDDWDPDAPLTRAQFEADPFCVVNWDRDGKWPNSFWLCRSNPAYGHAKPSMHSWVRMPNKTGRHVIYAFWWVADTDKAFYQTLDVSFDRSLRGDEDPDELDDV